MVVVVDVVVVVVAAVVILEWTVLAMDVMHVGVFIRMEFMPNSNMAR